MTHLIEIDVDELERLVEQRVAVVLNDLELLAEYDLNLDGELTDNELVLLDRLIAAEVYREFLGSPVGREAFPDEVLNGRFQVSDFIGEGGQGHTFLATDLDTGEEVAVKELAVVRLDDWKSLELFEREGAVLAQLDHPAIPKYIDAFHQDDEKGRRFFIAREFVEGADLEARLARGERFDEQRVLLLILHVCDVLEHLHSLTPPVVHRDIKPSNLIEDDYGLIWIVDFGSVQDALPRSGASTVSGTPGYMPIEQIIGRSVPATDVFALGVTAVYLLSGVSPTELEVKATRFVFDDVIDVSPKTLELLKRMTEPDVARRFQTMDEVARFILEPEESDALVIAPTHLPVAHEPQPKINFTVFAAFTLVGFVGAVYFSTVNPVFIFLLLFLQVVLFPFVNERFQD